MRMIDADALMEALGITGIKAMDCEKCTWGNKYTGCSRGRDFEDVCIAIEEAPTIEERKKGKWEIYVKFICDGDGFKCSECGFEGAPYWDFCPNCGADMRGEEDGRDS